MLTHEFSSGLDGGASFEKRLDPAPGQIVCVSVAFALSRILRPCSSVLEFAIGRPIRPRHLYYRINRDKVSKWNYGT
jgi:hypothetical protein